MDARQLRQRSKKLRLSLQQLLQESERLHKKIAEHLCATRRKEQDKEGQ
jgi:hypothetical protein